MKRIPLLCSLCALIAAIGCIGKLPGYGNASTGVPIAATGKFKPAAESSPEAGPAEEAEETEEQPQEEETAVAEEGTFDPLDWTYCRGPWFDGTSPETGLPDDFDPKGGEGSNVLWKRDDLGGRTTPITMNGKCYVILRADPATETEGERVVCVDAATGETVWENRFNVWSSDVPDTRVGWSSVVGDPETGNVYALGVCGLFLCIDGETGETKWSVPMHERFGLLSTYGGRTNFPIICDDLVIVSAVIIGWGDMAKPAHRFVAFDKTNGNVVWFKGTRLLPDDTTYSAPTLAVLNGQKALVFGSGDGAIWALQPRTGLPIWQYDISMRGVNTPPLVVGDKVFAGQSEENITGTAMGAVALIDGTGRGDITRTGQIWKTEEIMLGKTAPLLIDDRLYCFQDTGKLQILDAKTGEVIGRHVTLGTMMRSNPLYVDGKIYVFEANGRWYIYKPDADKGVAVVSKGRMPSGEEINGSPICSHGKIYVQSSGALYCLHDAEKEQGVGEIPQLPEETPAGENDKPAHLQVVPAELLLKPGRITAFKARLFNSKGQFLKETPAEFSIAGPGEISADGAYLAPADAGHAAATVTAKAEGLTGISRLRIVPGLPWEFDFEMQDQPPITWVGARYRHILREVDGSNVMVKITTIPKGTRSKCWFGHSDLANYTITAEVKGSRTDNKMPDIGLIAQGYTLDMQGASQRVQVRSWVPHDRRTEKTVPFAWEPDTWYVMKLQAAVEGDKAIVKGKIWPKGEEEPEAWLVEIEDAAPNREGSPGLFGNAKDAEIFLDNIKVFENKG